VLLIACANVANLMLVRMTARQQEIAVTSALGAGRGRVIRQLLTESLLVAGAGGVVGTAAAVLAVRALVRSARDIPRLHEVGIDLRVLGFSLAVTIITGLVFGLVPALGAGRLDLASTLRQGGRGNVGGQARARQLLTGAQIALSLMLLVGAGLLLKSFARLVGEDPGFASAHVLTMQLTPPRAKYPGDTLRFQLHERLRERLAAIPGVQAAGYVSRLPISGGESANGIVPEGLSPDTPEAEQPTTSVRMATADYFRAMNIPVKRGTLYTGREPRGAPELVVLVSESAAKTWWPGQDPIGKTVRMEWFGMLNARVVGVVGDVRSLGLDSLPRPTTYWSPSQFPGITTMTYTLRLAPGVTGVEQAVRRAVNELEPTMPVAELKTMDVTLAESVARRRLTTTLVSAFGVVALVLAAVGLYGVVAYGVAARTREFGVRVALGARQADVTQLVLGSGLRLAAVSAVAGVAAALVASRLLTATLYGVEPTDPVVFALATATLVVVALLASWMPARRAGRTDPVTALRAE
jgi:putative ABC transport system permease protein